MCWVCVGCVLGECWVSVGCVLGVCCVDYPRQPNKYKDRAVLLFNFRYRKAAVCQNDKLAPAAARNLSYPALAYPMVSLLYP